MMGVADGLALWHIYAEMPQAIRNYPSLDECNGAGMEQLSDSARRPSLISRHGKEILVSEADYDEYCYYVAGTVGQLVTELVIIQYQFSDDVAHVLRARAEACGRALQKTNIIKDFVEDIQRGICYLPDTWLQQADYTPLALQGSA
jgi:farnesyl-diphosphate farnesyltransferase